MRIEGFNKLQQELKEAQVALKALDGRLGEISCNPGDLEDVQRAIHEMELVVDAKVSRYRNNPLVAELAKAMKQRYREQMLRQVEETKKSDS